MKDIFKFNNGIFNIQESYQKNEKYQKIRAPKKFLKEEEPAPELTSDTEENSKYYHQFPPGNIENIFDLIDSMLGEQFGTPNGDNLTGELLNKIKNWGGSSKINFGDLQDKHAGNLESRAANTRMRAIPEPEAPPQVQNPEKQIQARVMDALSNIPVSSPPESDQPNENGKIKFPDYRNPTTDAPKDKSNDESNDQDDTASYIDKAYTDYKQAGGNLSRNELYKKFLEDGGQEGKYTEFASFIDVKRLTNDLSERKYINPRQPRKIVRHPSLAKW